ncbi:MAG: DNA polymerase III subunit chi [Ideonella sp.]|nr:DNA polymerase III subunit chi [Ideonella sp.]MBE7427342.1 DNA polymerase III subunit chi [Ideonella sp.]
MKLEFHIGVGDSLAYACRLLRKAFRQGSRVLVAGDGATLGRLDTLLWTFEQLEFVPHVRLRAGDRPDEALQRTPIWLVDRGAAWPPSWPPIEVAVNLGDPVVADVARFTRVIEIVGSAADAVHSGRARWRQYVADGLEPVRIAAKGAAADGDATQ